tara:strand:+ start:58 stop:264 length:207 start_codon:yes stop_codon:yes gene_type:complete
MIGTKKEWLMAIGKKCNEEYIKPITINATDIINGKKEELKKIIPNNNYNPNQSYKKAVNTLKSKTTFK